MKKIYLKPEVIRVDLCAVSMLAASTVAEMSAKSGQEATTGVKEKRGGWGNLWK